MEAVFESAGEVAAIRIHGDCHLGNLLWNERGPVFVDLDDCMMGPRVQDLWMLLSGPPHEQQRQWGEILEGYQQFANFDYREVLLVEALAVACGCCTMRPGWPSAGGPGLPPRLPLVRGTSQLGELHLRPAGAIV